MNKFLRGACFAAALVISASTLFGCKKDISEELSIITEVSDEALGITEGEILVNETIKVEKAIEGVVQNGNIETYVVFSNGPENPDFELQRNEYAGDSEIAPVYTFVKSGEIMFELFDGVGEEVDTAPDIYEALRIDFDADDIKSLESSIAEKGNTCYTLTMIGDYADKYDSSADGADFDCTEVVICYYINSLGKLTKRTCEITSTLTVNGEAQTVTRFIESKIA